MEKAYEELDEVKAANEKLRADCRSKTELLNNLKKVQSKQLVEIQEARLVIEKQSFESEEKTREISELKRTNEDLQRCLSEKGLILKRLNEANDKLRANGEEKNREFEEERRKLMSALDEASEKNIDLEQKNNVHRAEIEGFKGLLAAAEKKKMEVEKTAKALKEVRARDDAVIKMEEEKAQVEEKLKWKKEQFNHLEEAYEKLKNKLKSCKKEWEDERSKLLDEIYSLQTKLDSQTRISEDLQKKLQMCNSVLTQEETRRKHLEIQVSEFKAKYEDVFAEYQDARTQLDDLAGKRDEEVAELRHSLSTKDAYFKEMKYENGKLQQENCELLFSLKELQAATIQGSGNTALSKLEKKFQNLENTHKNCSANLRSKESEWSSQLEKMAEEINGYKLQLQSKDGALKEVEVELENCHSSTAKMRLQYEEISVMFLVLSRTVSEAQSRLANVKDEQTKDEKREEKSYSLLIEQLEQTNDALETANCELSDKTSEAYQLEFQLWIWKSIAKRLKVELQQNQNLRKRVEASLLEQVGVGEAMRQERNDLVHKLKVITSASSKTSDSEKESLIQIMKEKDKILREVQREVELLEQESLTRELEAAVFAHITAESELQNEREALKHKEDELCKVKNEATMVYKAWEKLAASKILTDVETEAKKLMIIELEEEISSIRQKLETSDESVSCFREEATKLGAELETKQTELVKQVTNLSLERQNLMCFISELENEMSKLCDEDTKPMKALEKTVQSCDGFGKENNNIGSPRLVMKHEDVAIEERSPFRQLNH